MGFIDRASAPAAAPALAIAGTRLHVFCLAAVLLMTAHGLTRAQPAAPAKSASAAAVTVAPVTMPQIEGRTIEGAAFKLASLKGKVVLVMFWSTNCAVCRDKMPELRTNYEGWKGKPFELVAVNTDTRVQDFLEYERIISATVPLKQRFVQLWTGETGYRDNVGKAAQLPAAFLVDKSGKIVERYAGRIPAEAWDRIADLL
ncbi:MAG: TlpA disulfide reductase family protein [Pseudomonadota bacterium]